MEFSEFIDHQKELNRLSSLISKGATDLATFIRT